MTLKIFSLNISSAPSLLIPNDTNNGFKLITLAIEDQRVYRITRQTTNPSGKISLDWLDFSLTSTLFSTGDLIVIDVPYVASLFSRMVEPNIVDLESLGGLLSSTFQGEVFKLLYVSMSVDKLIRELPSIIDFQAEYSIAKSGRKIRFIYYTLLDGLPVYSGCFGNIAFDDQRTVDMVIDSEKLVNTISDGDIDYHIIRVTTTPNLIITKKPSPDTYPLGETYTVNGIRYTLAATGNSLSDNSFYVYLSVSESLPREITENGFNVDPITSIAGYTVLQLSDTSYRFAITPLGGVKSLDVKISFVGPKG